MKSIFFKNFMLTAGMVIICFLIVGASFVVLGRNFVAEEKKDSMLTNAEEVVRSASAFSRSQDALNSWELRLIISSISHSTGNHIFITDEYGTVVSCGDMELVCPHLGRQIKVSVMQTLWACGELESLSDLGGFYTRPNYVVALDIPDRNGNAAGYVFVCYESSSIMDTWRSFIGVFLTVSIIILVAAVAVAYITSKRQARPLNEMADAAAHFAKGDFSARIGEYYEDDELGDLITAFNSMASALEQAEVRRREFIANVSHELKTPMTTISGFADGILDGTIPRESEGRYLATISSETKRLSRLVRSMLDVSQVQEEDPAELLKKTFDLSEVLRCTLLNFENKITDKGLDVDLSLPEEDMTVRGDEDAMTRVVYNLLDNAVKFSAPGSELGVSLWKQGNKAYAAVKNHGETIPPEELKLIFERFHKTDRSRSMDRDGVGLGLYLVAAILKNHQEDIFVTSEEGLTTFTFTMTLADKKMMTK